MIPVSYTADLINPRGNERDVFEFLIRQEGLSENESRDIEFLFFSNGKYYANLINPDENDWYRNIRPFLLPLRTFNHQRANVTILNNVIDISRDQESQLLYILNADAMVSISVFNLAGDTIKVLHRGRQSAGTHEVQWDGSNRTGRDVARGLYFIRIRYDDVDEYRKVLVVK